MSQARSDPKSLSLDVPEPQRPYNEGSGLEHFDIGVLGPEDVSIEVRGCSESGLC